MPEIGNDYDQYAPQPNGRLFSSSMFGFNKEEVLEYLDELADENYQRQEAAERQIADLNRTVQNLQQNLTDAHSAAQGSEQAYTGDYAEQLEIAQAATQQAEDELAEMREDNYKLKQENEWFRQEYQKAGEHIETIQKQLNDVMASGGGVHDGVNAQRLAAAERALTETRTKLDEKERLLAENNRLLSDSKMRTDEMERLLVEGKTRLDEKERLISANAAEIEKLKQEVEDSGALQGKAAADTIIADANAQAERIRMMASDEKDRVHRQIQTSAGNIAESVTNLRAEIGNVEGDVAHVLMAVQNALSDVGVALNRTEQSLNIMGVQVERFPAPSAPVPKPQQLVYFQPVDADAKKQSERKVPQVGSFGQGNFRRVTADSSSLFGKPKPFRAAYTSNIAPLGQTSEAYQVSSEEERMRTLADTLVETLMQMMH